MTFQVFTTKDLYSFYKNRLASEKYASLVSQFNIKHTTKESEDGISDIYTVEINSVEELMRFVEISGFNCIISEGGIEIYDGPREE